MVRAPITKSVVANGVTVEAWAAKTRLQSKTTARVRDLKSRIMKPPFLYQLFNLKINLC
jgi:hypothetical protein